MSSRMRITRGKTGSRRSHIKLSAPRLSTDKETGSLHLRHHVDMETGMYRGKKIFEPATPKQKKVEETEASEDASPAPEESLTPIEDTPPVRSGSEISKDAALKKVGEPKLKMPQEIDGAKTAPRQSKKKEK